jgi:hypothetical protein
MPYHSSDQKERNVLYFSLLLVAVVFSVSLYDYFFPREQIWEAKVFEVFHNEGKTTIYSYGNGKLKIIGNYDIELDAIYRITFKSRKRNTAEFDIRVEKLSD